MISAVEGIRKENMTVMSRGEWGTFSQEAQGWPLKSALSAETSHVKARREASRLLTARSTDFFSCSIKGVEGTHSSFILVRNLSRIMRKHVSGCAGSRLCLDLHVDYCGS